MPSNSKIPFIDLTDTLNTQRLRTNQLIDSIGNISSLTTTADNIIAAINEHDAELGTITAGAMGTTASTVSNAIAELDGRLDSINETELLSPRATLSDSSATNIVRGNLQVDTDLDVDGNTTNAGSVTIDGLLTTRANVVIGNSAGDQLYVNSSINTNVVPYTDSAFSLGSASKQWKDLHVNGYGYIDDIRSDNIVVSNDVTVSNDLEVQGISNLDSTNVAGDLDVTGSFTTITTDGLTEGSSNLYFTTARARAAISAGEGIEISSGEISGENATTSNKGIASFNSANFSVSNGAVSIKNNGIALGTKTTGDYVAGISGTANQITVSGSGGETSSVTIGLSSDVAIDSNLTVGGAFTVQGDFTVEGAQKLEGQYIFLLHDFDGVPLFDAGVSVDRGNEDSAVFQWKENGDYWEAGTVSDKKQIARQFDSAAFSNIQQTGSGALRLPAGTTAQRPTAAQGQIRYNKTTTSFEGYNGSAWGSLGGLIDVDQDTKIIAERASGTDSDTLQFITADTLRATLNNDGLRINQNIKPLDGGRLTLRSDSGDNGAPRVSIQSLNGSFDAALAAGTIDLYAMEDIKIETIFGRLLLEGDTTIFGLNGESQDRGLKILADNNGGRISPNNTDSSGYSVQPYIDFFDPTEPASFADGQSVITYSADSHNFILGGIYVRDEKGSGSLFDQDVRIDGTLTLDNPLQSNATNLILHADYTGTPPNFGAGGVAYSSTITVERGTKGNAQIRWDEVNDYWQVSNGDATPSLSRIATADWLTGGGGITFNSSTGEISHTDTSSVSNVSSDNSGQTFIQDITATFDTYGHVTGFTIGTGTATDTNTTYSAGADLDLVGTTFSLESTLNSVTDMVVTGDFTVDASGDIRLSAAGQQIYFDNGVGGEWTLNVPGSNSGSFSTPGSFELTVSGDFTVDAATDIVLDANGADIHFKDNNVTKYTFNMGANQELDVVGNFIIDGAGDITLDAVGDIILDAGNNIRLDAATGIIDLHHAGAQDVRFDVATTDTLKLYTGTSTLNSTFAGDDLTVQGDVTSLSDIRTKENIETVENSLDLVSQLRGVWYNKIGEEDRKVGVIAQEVEEVLPEVVKTDTEGMKSVDYGKMVGVLIEAIKDLKAEIEELKAGN